MLSSIFIDSPHLAHVWRAGELGGNSQQTVATGYAALDSVLSGGGWPRASLTELLQPQAGLYEWGLLLPALAAMQKTQARGWTVLIGAPHVPFAPSLAAQALDMQRLLRIHAEKNDAPALLWATREALQCADVGAVVAWLPDARSAHLRRLQIAAHTHNKLLFVFRLQRAQHESSPAPLRLLLQAASHGLKGSANSMGHLLVDVFKRRGPPLAAPVLLDTRPQRLAAFLAASQSPSHRAGQRQSAPVAAQAAFIDLSDLLRKPLHALDRVTSLSH
ncbi:MAG: translesion DNA synthesis-associated protein ImuA [Polaromonas sp.]|nr:translesion DNA synthesis-associated protein ImuA [Polaromonas sp.]